MECTEESNNQLLKEMETLRKQLRNYQTLDKKNKTIEKENEELRVTVTELQETNRNFQNKTKQLEKDRVLLNDFQEELQSKLSVAHKKLESLSSDHQSICLAYNEEKQRLIELEEIQDSKDRSDEDLPRSQEYFTNVISDLTTQKQVLQAERNKMETELFQVREELSRLMLKNASTIRTSEGRNYLQSMAALKPIAPNSLREELQEITVNDFLPSPIVGDFPSVGTQNESYENDVFDSPSKSLISPLSLVSLSNSSNNSSFAKCNDYFTAISQVAADFRDKKEKALQTISDLVHMENNKENKEIRESLHRQLEKEMEFFAEKIWLLSLARKASQKRVSKLLALIEKLKDENQQMQEERDKALQKIGDLSLGSEDLETRIEELSCELHAKVEHSRNLEKQCDELTMKLKKAESELKYKKFEKDSLSTSIEHEDYDGLTVEFRELQKKYEELEIEHGVVLARISEIEQASEKTSFDLAVEKRRVVDLQESLSMCESKHEQELQDIMDLIPADDTENNRESQTSPSGITGHQVRTKLKSFLSTNYKTIRDSPDGKPTHYDDKNPLRVSTPLDCSRLISCPHSNEIGNNFEGNSRLFNTPYPEIDLKEHTVLLEDCSLNSSDQHECSGPSSVSPNLIRPFDVVDDSCVSPNLIDPFKRLNNETFVKSDDCITDDMTNKCTGNTYSFVNETGDASNRKENCVKNLLSDFASDTSQNHHQATNLPHSHLSTGHCSRNSRSSVDGGESSPISSTIPARFRKISNITPPSWHCESKDDGASPKVVSSTIDKGKERVQSGTNHKLDFKYDGRSNGFNHIDESVVSERLRSLDNEELNDSDCSSPLLNNYIDGVSLSWSLPTDEKELEKLFKSVSLAFRTDKESLQQRLEYQGRACNAAKRDITKLLNIFSISVQSLERSIGEKDCKDLVYSLYHEIEKVEKSLRTLSLQYQQFGGYQQEARMMSGVNVLISYGESLSRHLETLQDTISCKKEEENSLHYLKGMLYSHNFVKYYDFSFLPLILTDPVPNTRQKTRSSATSRSGSKFYSLVSSVARASDNFRLFGDNDEDDEKISLSFQDDDMKSDVAFDDNDDDEAIDHIADKVDRHNERLSVPNQITVTKRSYLGRCFHYSINLVIFLALIFILVFVLVRYSVCDRYFITTKIHDYIKRFEIIHYVNEPAV
ncbi:inositol 1,4,5-triphosphate receptor associated 2-like isoform X2 [Xenia sp. Carnegie-2017]|uniref:inositol 1,4,5-triphosphate receptor associated 2-like isoform X2 n=1 Tax=Xenia sp. Carnegie-2017 TaxID=2897299 RepID=UPI001F04647A|nr:inositol 1,4,5-triphosphate receptor associated 2-like isoform X2 [Xenia sp. Carnegie-2017]